MRSAGLEIGMGNALGGIFPLQTHSAYLSGYSTPIQQVVVGRFLPAHLGSRSGILGAVKKQLSLAYRQGKYAQAKQTWGSWQAYSQPEPRYPLRRLRGIQSAWALPPLDDLACLCESKPLS